MWRVGHVTSWLAAFRLTHGEPSPDELKIGRTDADGQPENTMPSPTLRGGKSIKLSQISKVSSYKYAAAVFTK